MANWEDPDVTDQVEEFFLGLAPLPAQPARGIVAAIDFVAEHGPATGRPMVDVISLDPDYREFIPLFGRHLKEIRVGKRIRILCTFSADRRLVLLYIGDKEGEWTSWYRRAIPEAARLFREYLQEREGRRT